MQVRGTPDLKQRMRGTPGLKQRMRGTRDLKQRTDAGDPRLDAADARCKCALRQPGTTLLCYTSITRISLSVRRFVSVL